MGSDTALLPLAGRTMLERIIEKISPLFAQVLVIVDNADKVCGLHLQGAAVYEDAIQRAGALAGLYTGLCHSVYTRSMVFSCDMPFVNETLILQLIEAAQDLHYDAHYFVTADEYDQPFPGIYTREVRLLIRTLLDQQERDMMRFFEVADGHPIALQDPTSSAFRKLNCLEDYWEAVKMMEVCRP
jgi:molybdopterin-guanine dinucleotide biosynthesis protein A